MRVIYIDPGLRNDLGHHANSCRAIMQELRRRGIEVWIVGHVTISAELQAELGAIPLFRVHTYVQFDGDPFAGWLNMFDMASRVTAEDLSRIGGIRPDDLVYLNSAQPAQFHAMVKWYQSLADDVRPRVVIEFGTDAGVTVASAGDAGKVVIHANDYRTDPRAMFHRFAANQLHEDDLKRFHLVTFDPVSSAIFSHVLGKRVTTIPLPQYTRDTVISRAGRRPITVGVLGHQRADKGYQLMPLIARLLLAHEPDIQLLIHNGAPHEMPVVQNELRAHAKVDSRVTLNEEMAGPPLWDSLLRETDLILCPYDPIRFRSSYSALATEAVANGIPLVVPKDTSLSDLLRRFGEPGVSFDTWSPESIVAAVRAAIADFDALAQRAVAAAGQWNATMGVGNMVGSLLGFTQSS